jgi:hypothetical protein
MNVVMMIKIVERIIKNSRKNKKNKRNSGNIIIEISPHL